MPRRARQGQSAGPLQRNIRPPEPDRAARGLHELRLETRERRGGQVIRHL